VVDGTLTTMVDGTLTTMVDGTLTTGPRARGRALEGRGRIVPFARELLAKYGVSREVPKIVRR
jgi:hypothetical protein